MLQKNSPSTSLRDRLLMRLWIPLSVLLIFGALMAITVARHFGNVVHDRWLYDSAMSLAAQIKFVDGNAALDLSATAVRMFEWDSVDQIYEEVTSSKRGRIFGNAALRTPPGDMTHDHPIYYDDVVDGRPVRVVAVSIANESDKTDTIRIQVAETENKRKALVTEIILTSVPLQVGILIIAGTFIWLAVTSSLRLLDNISARLAGYEPEGLRPFRAEENVPSEVQPLVHSLNLLILKLSEAQEAQRRFVTNAAHQLRTPLATMQIEAERASREPDSAKRDEALRHMLEAVMRLRRVAQQLLTLARSEPSAEGMLKMVRFDLAILVRDELERWADTAIAHDIDLGYDGAESDVHIVGEAHLIRELIGNLVDNAIQYGRPGGEVTVHLRQSPTTIYVDDDGPGIPPEERNLVLERFYRRSQSTGQGSGLGLAIAHEIAARHGARMRIVDRPQAPGTRVEIVFQE